MKKNESKVKKEQTDKVYKEEISKQTEGDEILSRPRNVKQLQNLRSKVTGQARLSRDAILNTHTIAYKEPNFVWKLTTVPDLVVICGMGEMTDELKQLLKKHNPNQMLSYDTTFCSGEFYVSSLLFGIQCSRKTQSCQFFSCSMKENTKNTMKTFLRSWINS